MQVIRDAKNPEIYGRDQCLAIGQQSHEKQRMRVACREREQGTTPKQPKQLTTQQPNNYATHRQKKEQQDLQMYIGEKNSPHDQR